MQKISLLFLTRLLTTDPPTSRGGSNGSSDEPGGSGSGTKGSGGKSIAEDWRNYQFDSDSDFDYGKNEDNSKSESFKSETHEKEEAYSIAAADPKPVFEAKITKMEDLEAIQDLKNGLSSVKKMYESAPHIPAAKAQIPLLEEKIAMCESRMSHLETENMIDSSKDKGKGKANNNE